MPIKAILTDIEGTTSAITFVFEVLFPFAAKHLPDFVRRHAAEPAVAAQLDAVRAESGEAQADVERVVAILLEWIAADRKATPLKALQGMVWEQGYRAGSSRGTSTRMRWTRCAAGTPPATRCTCIPPARSRRRS